MSTSYSDIVSFALSEYCDVRSPKDRALLVVGAIASKASLFDSNDPRRSLVSIADTNGGEVISQLTTMAKLTSREEERIFRLAEARFIGEASGNLTVTLPKPDMGGIFKRYHLPRILDNPEILTVNGVSTSKLLGLYEADRSPSKDISLVQITEILSKNDPFPKEMTLSMQDRELQFKNLTTKAIEEIGGERLALLSERAKASNEICTSLYEARERYRVESKSVLDSSKRLLVEEARSLGSKFLGATHKHALEMKINTDRALNSLEKELLKPEMQRAIVVRRAELLRKTKLALPLQAEPLSKSIKALIQERKQERTLVQSMNRGDLRAKGIKFR